MTSRQFWRKRLLLLSMTAGLGTLVSASSHSSLRGAPDCPAGPRLCYDVPVNAGSLINTGNFEGGPALSQDGLTLLFGAARLNSLGQLDEDIYVATREAVTDPFGPPQNLGAPGERPWLRGLFAGTLGRRSDVVFFFEPARRVRASGSVRHDSQLRRGSVGASTESRLQHQQPVLRWPAEHRREWQNALLGFEPARRIWRLRYLGGHASGVFRGLSAGRQRWTSGEHTRT